MPSMFYVFQGKTSRVVNNNDFDLRIPIDITRKNDPTEQGTRLAAEANDVEELKTFFCDYYWAMHENYFLRHTDSLNGQLKSELQEILSKQEERRTPNPTASGRFKRRPRTYKSYLPPPHFTR